MRMPKWKIHNKWAEKIGIPEEISNTVNKLIDFPLKDEDYVLFCIKKIKPKCELNYNDLIKNRVFKNLIINQHDCGRNRKTTRDIQIEYLEYIGGDNKDKFVKAWYLHHILDYFIDDPEIFERFKEQTTHDNYLETQSHVIEFVKENRQKILEDVV